MVRHRKRTTEKAGWTAEAMEAAFAAVNSGSSIRAAGRMFNIPERTLRDRLKSGSTAAANMGKKPLFSHEQEKELANHLVMLSKVFYGMSQIELRRMVYEYAERNHIRHPFSKDSRLAGKDWVSGFMKRNPELSLRKPEPTSIHRMTAFNEEEVKLFYNNLEKVMEKGFTPDRL